MNKINWAAEQRRFIGMAYEPARRAARRAFKRWPERKRDDAEGEFMAKMWDQWKPSWSGAKTPSRCSIL